MPQKIILPNNKYLVWMKYGTYKESKRLIIWWWYTLPLSIIHSIAVAHSQKILLGYKISFNHPLIVVHNGVCHVQYSMKDIEYASNGALNLSSLPLVSFSHALFNFDDVQTISFVSADVQMTSRWFYDFFIP